MKGASWGLRNNCNSPGVLDTFQNLRIVFTSPKINGKEKRIKILSQNSENKRRECHDHV